MLALGIAVATVALFIVSSVYYVACTPLERRIIGEGSIERGEPSPVRIVAELVRNVVLASGFAWIAGQAGSRALPDSLLLALVLWLVFPVVLLAGSISWERVPFATAVLHAGDWLLKMLLIGLIIGLLH